MGVAWTLAKGDKEEYWRLYRLDWIFHSFEVFKLVFLGLFMREPRALTVVSDSHLLVGFQENVFVFVRCHFYIFQEKCVISSHGRGRTS